MPKINIIAPIEPVPFKRANSHGKRRFNDPRYTSFKTQLGYFAKAAMQGRAPFVGAIKITINVFKKNIPTALNYGDWDNHAKAVSDALQGICFLDDKQITEGHVHLHNGEPRLEIELEKMR